MRERVARSPYTLTVFRSVVLKKKWSDEVGNARYSTTVVEMSIETALTDYFIRKVRGRRPPPSPPLYTSDCLELEPIPPLSVSQAKCSKRVNCV